MKNFFSIWWKIDLRQIFFCACSFELCINTVSKYIEPKNVVSFFSYIRSFLRNVSAEVIYLSLHIIRPQQALCLRDMSAAAVMYRIPFTWKQRKSTWKWVHAVLMFLALLLSILGLCAVFDFHRATGIPDMYSLHSWVGICTVVLFAFQVQITNIYTFILLCKGGVSIIYLFCDLVLLDSGSSGWLASYCPVLLGGSAPVSNQPISGWETQS